MQSLDEHGASLSGLPFLGPTLRRGNSLAPVQFDALGTRADASICQHAACQCGVHFAPPLLLLALDFWLLHAVKVWHVPIVGNFYERGMKKWSFSA